MRVVWRHYWIAVALLAAAIPLPGLVARQLSMPLRQPLDALPHELDGWRGRDQQVSERVRDRLGTSDVLMREYVDASGVPMGLYVSFFARQQKDEVSHSPKNCLPGAGWQPVREDRIPYSLAGRDAPTINEIVFEKAGQRQLILYWLRERIVASEYMVKLYMMWDALVRKRSDGALIRISAPIVGSEAATRQRCVDFMRVVLPRLDELFPGPSPE